MSNKIVIKDDIETQWKKWSEENTEDTFKNIDDNELRDIIIKDLSYVSKMDVKEYTLYQKWCEIQQKYPSVLVNDLWEGEKRVLADDNQRKLITESKSNIWNPENIEEYLELEPELIFTGSAGNTNKYENLSENYNCLRNFISSGRNNSNIGRNLNFIIHDKKSKKYLGLICISSDFLDLTPRDKFIGWDRELKTSGRKINHTGIGSTIVPFQPLGYNYAGGKLMALLCLSTPIQELWEKLYGDKLVALTTTSLYGKTKVNGLSQYDNLDHWLPMGFTSGSVSYEPEKETRYMIREWLKKNYTRKYFEWYHATNDAGQPHKRDHKNRSMTFAFSKLNIPKELIRSEHSRGIYFSPLYDKSCEFLRGEHNGKDMVKLFDTSVESLYNTWKTKHAKPRISILKKKNRVSKETLFYDDLIVLTWEETKNKYLTQIGR